MVPEADYFSNRKDKGNEDEWKNKRTELVDVSFP